MGEEIRLRLEGYKDKEGKQKAGIYIFNTCYHLIRTLPEITHDKNQPEKYDTNGEDHAIDAIGYLCLARPYKPTRPARPSQSSFDQWVSDESEATSVWSV
jgi:hypothetical protein